MPDPTYRNKLRRASSVLKVMAVRRILAVTVAEIHLAAIDWLPCGQKEINQIGPIDGQAFFKVCTFNGTCALYAFVPTRQATGSEVTNAAVVQIL